MLHDALCRWKFLKQKWSAYKSWLVGIDILASSTAATQARVEPPEEPLGRAVDLGFWVAWIWRGILGQVRKKTA